MDAKGINFLSARFALIVLGGWMLGELVYIHAVDPQLNKFGLLK